MHISDNKIGDKGDELQSQQQQQQQPYSNFHHPYKSFMDKILSIVLPYIVPFYKFENVPSDNSSDEVCELVESFREELRTKLGVGSMLDNLNSYAKSAKKCGVISISVVVVERKKDILTTLSGIDSSLYLKELEGADDDSIELVIHRVTSKKVDVCSIIYDSTLHAEISSECAILIWFHGGGMISGGATDLIGVNVAQRLVRNLSESVTDEKKDMEPM